MYISFLPLKSFVDKEGKNRLEYMIEIGDSKGNFPPTPHDPPAEARLTNEMIPGEAKDFAVRMMKQYLLTMSD